MAMDRSWMYDRLFPKRAGLKPIFVTGVYEFVTAAMRHDLDVEKKGGIRCPCLKCKLRSVLEPEQVILDLYKVGFMPDYLIWTSHGEVDPSANFNPTYDIGGPSSKTNRHSSRGGSIHTGGSINTQHKLCMEAERGTRVEIHELDKALDTKKRTDEFVDKQSTTAYYEDVPPPWAQEMKANFENFQQTVTSKIETFVDTFMQSQQRPHFLQGNPAPQAPYHPSYRPHIPIPQYPGHPGAPQFYSPYPQMQYPFMGSQSQFGSSPARILGNSPGTTASGSGSLTYPNSQASSYYSRASAIMPEMPTGP